MTIGLSVGVEIAVQALSLSNVDLSAVGFYRLRISCQLEDSSAPNPRGGLGSSAPALPFALILPPDRQREGSRRAAYIDELACAFVTSAVPVAYSEDAQLLEELALFRLEIPLSSLADTQAREGPSVLIAVELLYGKGNAIVEEVDEREPTVEVI
ncbi:hypothetical protein T492DRAFT_52152 [Pavlovales sp. CCMP2436]|nr:hypothetical protein T492DRAFT_52152 [Pavlovales sp. CCMP2436]